MFLGAHLPLFPEERIRTMELRISGTIEESITDGPGYRFTVFTQGCPHRCPGCHNPQTHDPAGGKVIDTDSLLPGIKEDPLLSGVTFSGGEPFLQPAPLADLAEKVKPLGLNVWVYSGWTYEELKAMENPDVERLLAASDVLVDGRFIQAEKSIALLYRGSRNQRLVDLNKTRAEGQVAEWTPEG